MRRAILLSLATAVTAEEIINPPTASATALLHWRNQLHNVRQLRTRDLHENSKLIRTSRSKSHAPSFSRLFDHETWAEYTSQSPLTRLIINVMTWRTSTVLHAVLPCCLLAGLWALVVGHIDRLRPDLLSRLGLGTARPITSLALELQGTAIGLLLVFRTNNGYDRLAEARALLGRVLCLCREIAQTIACTWPLTPLYEEHEELGGTMGGGVIGGEAAGAIGHPGAIGGLPCDASLQVVRYLVAFAWSLKATLRAPIVTGESLTSPEDVLRALLPPDEVNALLRSPSVPVALVGRLRMLFAQEQRLGRLQSHVHLKLEEDLRDLNLLLADNQRLFHSPIPPTMSRHVLRCLLIWLMAVPIVLCGHLPPVGNCIASFVTSFIFLGIEEIGAQVEQPFELMPLWQLCHLMAHEAEAAVAGDAPGHVEGIF